VELLIDGQGVALQAWDISVNEAVWHRGFVHIRSVGPSLLVSLCPRRAQPLAKGAAFYAIADFNPEHTFLRTTGSARACEPFTGFRPAFRRIHALCVAAGTEESSSVYPPDESARGVSRGRGELTE
jgi:hypothetical protein